MRQQFSSESESTNDSDVITLENFLPDTVDLINLKVAHQIAFEEMEDAIRRKAESLRDYAKKPGASQKYIDRENEFISTIHDYINVTETLLEQMNLRKREDTNTIKEAYLIFSELGKMPSNAIS